MMISRSPAPSGRFFVGLAWAIGLELALAAAVYWGFYA
jgi:hypothetical protein